MFAMTIPDSTLYVLKFWVMEMKSEERRKHLLLNFHSGGDWVYVGSMSVMMIELFSFYPLSENVP